MPIKKKRPPPSPSSKLPKSKPQSGKWKGNGASGSDSDLSALSSPGPSSPPELPAAPSHAAGPSTIRAPRSRSVGEESAASSALSDPSEEPGADAPPPEDGGEADEEEPERDDRSATSSTVPLSRAEQLGSDDESELTEEEDAPARPTRVQPAAWDEPLSDDEAVRQAAADMVDDAIAVDDAEPEVQVKKEAVGGAQKEAGGIRRKTRSDSSGNSSVKPSSSLVLPPDEEDEDDLTPPPPTSDRVIPSDLPSSPQAGSSQAGGQDQDQDEDMPLESSPPAALPTSELTIEVDESVRASDADPDEDAAAADDGEEGEGDGEGDVTMRPGDVNGVLDALAEMGAHATVQGESTADAEAEVEAVIEGDEEGEEDAQEGDDTDSVTFSAIPTRLTSHSSHAPLPTPAATKALLLLEVKFAALRDRLYMERMEEAAEEEEMLLAGTHPALAYLYKTLGERREKLHEAASRKHKQVVEELARCREGEEAAVWSWWMDERDRVHWEEFEQTWSKRRRLAREKNELETPKIAKPIPRPSADRPLKLDWSSGYTPSRLSMDDATHDLALMENRRPPQHVPRTLPSILAQYPELQASSSNSHQHYPEDPPERNQSSYASAHGTSYPRQTAPFQSYGSHPSSSHSQQPHQPPSRTLSNPAQVFNSLASGAPPDPGVGRQIGSAGSNSSGLGRYPSSENIPAGNLLGSSIYGPPIPSPLGGLSSGTSSIGQSALGLTGRAMPGAGTSFFQPLPPPTAHAAPSAAGGPGDGSRALGRSGGGHENETLAQRIDRERREREVELMRERQRFHLKYATQPAPASHSSGGASRADDAKKEGSASAPMSNGNGNGNAHGAGPSVKSPPGYRSTTSPLDLWSAPAKSGAAPSSAPVPASADLEVKRESISAPSGLAKSPTPNKATVAGPGNTKVNGNGPTTHIEIINIHDPVRSPLPTPAAPPIAATSATPGDASAAPKSPEVSSKGTPADQQPTPSTGVTPSATENAKTPQLPMAAPVVVEEDITMLHPASPPSSSFEGPPSVPASLGGARQDDEDRMDVDEEPGSRAPGEAAAKLEQLSGNGGGVPISAT